MNRLHLDMVPVLPIYLLNIYNYRHLGLQKSRYTLWIPLYFILRRHTLCHLDLI